MRYGETLYGSNRYAQIGVTSGGGSAIVADAIRIVDLGLSSSFGLQGDYATTRATSALNMPTTTDRRHGRVYRDGNDYGGRDYNSKTIAIDGELFSSTASTLSETVRTLKKIIGKRGSDGNVSEVYLDITPNGETSYRRYKGQFAGIDKIFSEDHYHITHVPFSLDFVCTDPFGRDIDATKVTQDGNTTNSVTVSLANTGDDVTLPSISIQVVSVTGGTAMTITNTSMSERNVLHTYLALTAGDLITFDFANCIARQNSSYIDPLGNWFPLITGTNTLQFDFTTTSIETNITITYKNAYL
ncbi:MAG: hypothetical protein WCP97_00510 [bacterium]